MNKTYIQKQKFLEENISEIVCSLEESSEKMIFKQNIIDDNLKAINKYEKNLNKIKEILNGKNKEFNFLKELIKRNSKLNCNQSFLKYLEFIKLKNQELNSKLIIFHNKELMINYKNRIINELLKSKVKNINENNTQKYNGLIFQGNNKEINKQYLDKNDSVKSISSISIKLNGNTQNLKPKEIKIENNNNIKKNKDKFYHKWKVNNSFNQLKNKEYIFFNDDNQIKTYTKNNNTKDIRTNNSNIIYLDNELDKINESIIIKNGKKRNNNSKRINLSQDDKIININYKYKKNLSNYSKNNSEIKSSKRKLSNGNSTTKESRNNSISLNHSTDYLIEARENLKKILFKDPKLKSKLLNETFYTRDKNNNYILNVSSQDNLKKGKNKYLFKDNKSDMRQFFFQNALLESLHSKLIDEKNKKSFDYFLNVLFIKLTSYHHNLKKYIFQTIRKYYKINFVYFLKIWLKKYKLGRKLSNILINISKQYNKDRKKNQIEIIEDNEFLNNLNFKSIDGEEEINKYKESLLQIKKITKEIKEIEKKISEFTNNIMY